MPSKKYPRTLHAHPSKGTTSDDRFLPTGYVQAFADMNQLVVTEKLDGQNNCFNRHGVFARTHATPSTHPWDKPLRERWQLIKNDLGDLEVFGENMYGIHSIAYRKLDSYFYVFAVREKDRWLSWEEVKFYAGLLDFPTVPTYPIKRPLRGFLAGAPSEDAALEAWLTAVLGMPWLASTETGGRLGGYDPATELPASEGFVIRNAADYLANDGPLPVAANEFGQVMKLVRAGHVKTDVHWTKDWRAAALVDYARFGWLGYSFVGAPS